MSMCGSHQRLGLGRRSESELRLASPFHAQGGKNNNKRGYILAPPRGNTTKKEDLRWKKIAAARGERRSGCGATSLLVAPQSI